MGNARKCLIVAIATVAASLQGPPPEAIAASASQQSHGYDYLGGAVKQKLDKARALDAQTACIRKGLGRVDAEVLARKCGLRL